MKKEISVNAPNPLKIPSRTRNKPSKIMALTPYPPPSYIFSNSLKVLLDNPPAIATEIPETF